MEKLTLLGKPQDADGEDDISISMKSGFCTQSERTMGDQSSGVRSAAQENQFKFSENCNEAYPRLAAHVFYDYPMMISLNENDFLANDHAKSLHLKKDHVKLFHALLQDAEGKSYGDGDDGGSYRALEFHHIFTIGEQIVPEDLKKLAGGDLLCIHALDIATNGLGGKAAKAAKKAKSVNDKLAMTEKLGARFGHGSDEFNKLNDLLELCADEVVELGKYFGNELGLLGGTAYYLAQFVVEDAITPPPKDLPVWVSDMNCSNMTIPSQPEEESTNIMPILLTVLILLCCVCVVGFAAAAGCGGQK